MRVVLDTCILKLATFPADNNASALARMLDTIDRGDVRMVEGREQAGLTLESRETIGIARHRRGQDLDGDVSTEDRVVGAIDLTHAARTKRGQDVVGTKTSAM